MYKIIYYKTINNKEPVKKFINNLNIDMQAKAVWEISLLAEKGKNLTEPYCKYIKDGVYELRIRWSKDISRIFYFFYIADTIILTNGFLKKTNKTPQNEIQKAINYKRDYERRNKK
jgi:phage-related protein